MVVKLVFDTDGTSVSQTTDYEPGLSVFASYPQK